MNKIWLVIADVDGTLLTPDKELTARARRAVLAPGTAGVAFAITSGRPPRGMRMVVGPLDLTTPIAAFDGGMLVHPDLSPMDEQDLPAAIETSWTRGSIAASTGSFAVSRDRTSTSSSTRFALRRRWCRTSTSRAKVAVSDELQAIARCEVRDWLWSDA